MAVLVYFWRLVAAGQRIANVGLDYVLSLITSVVARGLKIRRLVLLIDEYLRRQLGCDGPQAHPSSLGFPPQSLRHLHHIGPKLGMRFPALAFAAIQLPLGH